MEIVNISEELKKVRHLLSDANKKSIQLYCNGKVKEAMDLAHEKQYYDNDGVPYNSMYQITTGESCSYLIFELMQIDQGEEDISGLEDMRMFIKEILSLRKNELSTLP